MLGDGRGGRLYFITMKKCSVWGGGVRPKYFMGLIIYVLLPYRLIVECNNY